MIVMAVTAGSYHSACELNPQRMVLSGHTLHSEGAAWI
jgi:hypothetical protein